jgi:phosphoribosylglycinamide formyltransferase-1
MPVSPPRIAVLASGGGSNFQAILDHIQSGDLSAEIAFLLSNNSQAFCLERARQNGIPVIHHSNKTHSDPAIYEQTLLGYLHHYRAQVIVLAGYMKLVPGLVIDAFPGRILNIHPALLPKFGGPGMYGHRVHEAVISAGETISGATVHAVDRIYDHGEIVLQKSVPIGPGETAGQVAEKVLKIEHEIYWQAIKKVLQKF